MEFAGKLGRESNYGPRGRCNRHNAFKGKGVQDDGGCEYIWLGTFGWGHSCIWLGAALAGDGQLAGDTPTFGVAGYIWRGWGHSTWRTWLGTWLGTLHTITGDVAGDTPRGGRSGLGTHPTLAYAIDRSCL